MYTKDGAEWFKSTDYGDDEDRVVIRANGEKTYFASDIAYHFDKRQRGHDLLIDVWGADHHGYVTRVRGALQAMGAPGDCFEVTLLQLVSLYRGGEKLAMGKREGNFVTLRELRNEVGNDACRFFYLMRSHDQSLDFDLELAKSRSNENPVYYVQYAHARIAGILVQAEERYPDFASGDVSLLTHEAELALVRKMLRLPELVETMALNLEPHQLPYYAVELATAFHDFYEKCRVLTDDEALSKARLKLVSACKTALARTLDLMGMSAPERM
jgi:arginyl-tRNA synthetase